MTPARDQHGFVKAGCCFEVARQPGDMADRLSIALEKVSELETANIALRAELDVARAELANLRTLVQRGPG